MCNTVQVPAGYVMTTTGWSPQYSLADCKPAPVTPWPQSIAKKKACNEKKEEIPMANYAAATVVTADSIEKDQRRMLRTRAYDAYDKKVRDARKTFNIDSEEQPETVKEFIQRIKDGKFEIKKDSDESYVGNILWSLNWRDPQKPADKDGFKKAKEDLRTAYDALELRLAIIPVADALNELEAYIKA